MSKIFDILYISLLIIILFFLKNKKQKYINGCLLLFLLHFYIKDIGLDYEVYKNWYYQIGTNKINLFQLEPVVYELILYMNKLNLSHRLFFLFMGGISLYLNFIVEKKECKNIYSGTIFLILLNFFSGFNDAIRQFLAASIFLFSLFLIENKKKYGLLVLLLTLFIHKSSIAIILLYPLFYLNFSVIKYISTLILISMIGLFSKYNLINFLLKLNLFSQEKINKINYYLNYDGGEYIYINFLHKFLLDLMIYSYYVGVIILYIVLLKQKNFSKFQKRILNSGIIGSLIATYFIVIGTKTLAFRFLILFGIGNYILLENISGYKKMKLFIIGYFIIYNLIVLLYNAGIYDIKSPFYLL